VTTTPRLQPRASTCDLLIVVVTFLCRLSATGTSSTRSPWVWPFPTVPRRVSLLKTSLVHRSRYRSPLSRSKRRSLPHWREWSWTPRRKARAIYHWRSRLVPLRPQLRPHQMAPIRLTWIFHQTHRLRWPWPLTTHLASLRAARRPSRPPLYRPKPFRCLPSTISLSRL
jgi:hypothetical protein